MGTFGNYQKYFQGEVIHEIDETFEKSKIRQQLKNRMARLAQIKQEGEIKTLRKIDYEPDS